MTPADLLLDAALCAGVSLAVMLLGLLLAQRWAPAAALATAIAPVTGFCLLLPRVLGAPPQIWPVVAPGWLFYTALAGAAAGLLDQLPGSPRGLRALGRACGLLLAGGALEIILSHLWRTRIDHAELMADLCITVLFGCGLWLLLQTNPASPSYARGRSAARSAQLAAVCCIGLTASAALVMSKSFNYGRLGIGASLALAPTALLWVQRPSAGATRQFPATPVALLLFSTLLLFGRSYTDLTLCDSSLLAAMPWLYLICVYFLRPGRRRAVAAWLLLSLPIATIFWRLLPAFLQELNGGNDAYN